jgi:hypothetical protein
MEVAMKSLIFSLFILTAGIVVLQSSDLPESDHFFSIDMEPIGVSEINRSHQNLNIPEYEFSRLPTPLGITNYYDYMPGSYNSTPIRLESTGSGVIAILYTARESPDATRRVWQAWLDADGNVLDNSLATTIDRHEGFAGIDADPESNLFLVAWHRLDDNLIDWNVVFGFHAYPPLPVSWPPQVIIPPIPPYPPTMDPPEYICPDVFVGPSPEPDKRRVYVIAKNSTNNPVTDEPSPNPLIAYADFDEDDSFFSPTALDWNFTTIPMMDQWHIEGSRRPFYSAAVSDDGKVAFFGWNIVLDGDPEATPLDEEMFVFVNDNYAEGEWEYHSREAYWEIDVGPIPPPGIWLLPFDFDYIYWRIFFSHNQNSLFLDNDSKLVTMQNVFFAELDENQIPTGGFYQHFGYPKAIIFDFDTEEFNLHNLGFPPDDYNNEPALPIMDGAVKYGWPIYFHDPTLAFHENKHKVAVNDDMGWIAALWHDGLKNKFAFDEEPGYEDWEEVPEIAICISNDHGETWQDIIYLNSIETPELEGMIPVYAYPTDHIENLGDDWGRIHLMFMDDNSYGSYVQGQGEYLGGEMMYAALDIHFGIDVSADDDEIASPLINYVHNYPNPFNPETTISFSLQEVAEISIEIFNLRGQKVRTVVNSQYEAGHHSVVWDGNDKRGRAVASGVYMYRIKYEEDSISKKMMLVK